MSEVTTTEDVYNTVGEVLGDLSQSDAASASLGALDLIVQLAITDPDAVLTVACTSDGLRTDSGATDLEPDVVARMPLATAQALLRGELNPFLALDQGSLTVEGDVGGFVRAYPLLRRTVGPAVEEKLSGAAPPPLPAEAQETITKVMGHLEPADAAG